MAIDPDGPALRVEPVRGHGVPRAAGRVGRAVRHRSRRRLRPGVRARRHAVRRRSVGHDLPRRSRRGRRRRSRRCRPSVAAFHLALGAGRRAVCHRRRRCRRTTRSTASSPTARSRSAYAGVRAAAGAGVRSGTARCSSSKRSPGRAACTASPAAGRAASWCSPGPALVGVAFDPHGGARRLLERHGVSAADITYRRSRAIDDRLDWRTCRDR